MRASPTVLLAGSLSIEQHGTLTMGSWYGLDTTYRDNAMLPAFRQLTPSLVGGRQKEQ